MGIKHYLLVIACLVLVACFEKEQADTVLIENQPSGAEDTSNKKPVSQNQTPNDSDGDSKNESGGNSNSESGGNSDNKSGGNPDSESSGNSDNESSDSPDNKSGGNSDSESSGNSDNKSGSNPDSESNSNSDNRSGGNSNNESSSNSNSENKETTRGRIVLNLSSWDDSVGNLAFQVGVGYSLSTWSTEDGSLVNGKNARFFINSGDQYRFYWYVRNGAPQDCRIDSSLDNKAFKYSSGGDIVANVDCKTQAKLIEQPSTLRTLDFTPNATYPMPLISVKKLDGKTVLKTNKFLYTSTNQDVATINDKGIISLHKAGRFDVHVKLDNRFYVSEDELVYKFNAQPNETGIYIDDIEIGQSSLLKTDDPFHQLVANKETVIRAIMHARAENTASPRTQLSLTRRNGQSYQKDMHCPPTLNYDKVTKPSYRLEDFCYAILENSEELKYIEEGVSVKITSYTDPTHISKTTSLKVAPKAILNIYLVKAKISRTEPRREVLIAQVRDEDLKAMKEFLLEAFPVSEVNIRLRQEPYELGEHLIQALGQMKKIQREETKNGEFAYALVPGDKGLGSGYSDVSRGPSVGRSRNHTTIGSDINSHIRIMAHELGHAFGLYHAPCSLAGNVEQIFDEFWKRKPEAWQYSSKGILSDSPMYIRQIKQLKRPFRQGNYGPYISHPSDLMGYCGGYRLSKHNYKFVSEKISAHQYFRNSQRQTNSQRSASSISSRSLSYRPENYLVIQGEIHHNQIQLDPISTTSVAPLNTQTNAQSGYFVQISTQHSTMSYPLELINIDHLKKQTFELIVPNLGLIKQLSFSQQGQNLNYQIKGLENQDIRPLFTTTAEPDDIYLKNGIIHWSSKYKWMSATLHQLDKNQVLADQVTGNQYKLDENIKSGEIEISLSNGINTFVKKIPIP